MFLMFLIIFSTCLMVTSCSTEDVLKGTWIPDEKTNSHYPERYLSLNSDGSGSVDGYSCKWTIEDDILTLNVSYKSYVYKVRVEGNSLMLDEFKYSKQ